MLRQNEILEALESGELDIFFNEILNEQQISDIAECLKTNEEKNIGLIVDQILSNELNEICDWNFGNILNQLNYQFLINKLKYINSSRIINIYNSIGIAWVLGECPFTDSFVIGFLYDILNYATNDNAWWNAAFSIERLEGKSAITVLKSSIKQRKKPSLDECLANIKNRKYVIHMLNYANNETIKTIIYPQLKQIVLHSNNEKEQLNALWLLGRLRLLDVDTMEYIEMLIKSTSNYILKQNVLQIMADSSNDSFLDLFNEMLDSPNLMVKKIAIRGLANLYGEEPLKRLKYVLEYEKDIALTGEISRAIYKLSNVNFTEKRRLKNKYLVNENGLIGDDSDKWYADSAIYSIFSDAEDVENVCFELIKNYIKNKKLKVQNPVDLATGTGRTAKNIIREINYSGKLFAVDYSVDMLQFLQKSIDRQKLYVNDISLCNTKIENFKIPNGEKSSLVISSFGFPSKFTSKERCRAELKAVYDMLTDDGIFVTIGWDETFNDELNYMWYKYIPDDINCTSFEEWREKRSKIFTSPRNCGLSWYKRNMQIPLIFDTLDESVNVIGHLFGRDAGEFVLKNDKRVWWMSMGITIDTKESIKKSLEEL